MVKLIICSNRWASSLHSILVSNLTACNAFTDYQTLIDTVPQSDSLYWEAKKALRVLEPRVEEVKKRDIDKMMGQLKTVGNSVLGKSPRGYSSGQ
jgi:hypothetical protein